MKKVFEEANKCLIDRYEEAWALTVAMTSNTHAVLIGPPGIAKSLLIRTLCKAMGATYFERTLSEWTEPQQLVGPVSLDGLKQSPTVYEVVTQGMLPDAHIAFLDEVNRAAGSIQDTLLTLMQERIFQNGSQVVHTPLRSLIGATNTDFEPGQQDAFADRWLIRMKVYPIPHSSWDKLLFTDLPKPQAVSSVAEWDAARDQSRTIQFSEDAKAALKDLVLKLRAEKINVSDRRMRESIKVIQAEAYMHGASQVEPEHLEILKHVYWTYETQRVKAEEIIVRTVNPASAQLQEYIKDFAVVMEEETPTDEMACMAQIKKLNKICSRVKSLKSSPKADRVIKDIESTAQQLSIRMLEMDSSLAPPPPAPV